MFNKITVVEIEAYDKAVKQNDFNVAGIFVGEGVGRIKR